MGKTRHLQHRRRELFLKAHHIATHQRTLIAQLINSLSTTMGSVPQYNPADTRLFKPLKLGNNELQHRIAFAPLTRYRNDDDNVPTDLMEKYYADRACAPGTLVISEATG